MFTLSCQCWLQCIQLSHPQLPCCRPKSHSASLYLTQVHWHSGCDLHNLQSHEGNMNISNKIKTHTNKYRGKKNQMPSTRWQSSPRFGALPVCLPPRSLKKPRPNEARAFLVPKFPSLVAFPLVGEEELRPVLFRPYEKGKKTCRDRSIKAQITGKKHH